MPEWQYQSLKWAASKAISRPIARGHMFHLGLERARQGIAEAARAAGRDPSSITLVAVSKTFPAPAIVPVIEAGQTIFGENRVQEAKAKWPALRALNPKIRLHLIGPLQSNKADDAVSLFNCIHSVDRVRIAEALAAEMRRQQRHLELFIQVNTGAETQKAGVLPSEADQFIAHCRDVLELSISGLMCIPPVSEDPKPHFELLAAMARRNNLANLSMGMSADFAQAIACGATHVRVGTAIFGTREQVGHSTTRPPALS
jgi:PLP dependent protein